MCFLSYALKTSLQRSYRGTIGLRGPVSVLRCTVPDGSGVTVEGA
jgi:hypothetical protein